MTRSKPRYYMCLCTYLVQQAHLMTSLSGIILFDTQKVDPNESRAILEAQMEKEIARILWDADVLRPAENAASGCLVSTDVRSSNK